MSDDAATPTPTASENPATVWDTRYQAIAAPFGERPNDFLAAASRHLPPNGRVVSLGEGDGRNGVWLAQQGFAVTGVDISSVGLEKARRLADTRGVTLQTLVGDVSAIGLPPCDAVVSIFCHLPPLMRRAAYQNAQNALSPSGVVLVEAYHPRQIGRGTGGPQTPSLLVTLDDLIRDLNQYTLIEGREVEREVIEGELHTGAAWVTQAVFRKEP